MDEYLQATRLVDLGAGWRGLRYEPVPSLPAGRQLRHRYTGQRVGADGQRSASNGG